MALIASLFMYAFSIYDFFIDYGNPTMEGVYPLVRINSLSNFYARNRLASG